MRLLVQAAITVLWASPAPAQAPASPAMEAGIKVGDVIVSIDDHHAQGLTLTEMRRMLRHANAHYTIGVLRGNSRLRIGLQLRPLI